MNDRWTTKQGKRWNKSERDRASRLFRAHVDTPHNRSAGRSCRIHRESCHWHPDVEGEAHHLDYSKPFMVVWLGASCGCHRRVDHGSLKIPKKAIWDYTSLIATISKPGLLKSARADSKACICGRRRKNAPHKNGCPRETIDGIPF